MEDCFRKFAGNLCSSIQEHEQEGSTLNTILCLLLFYHSFFYKRNSMKVRFGPNSRLHNMCFLYEILQQQLEVAVYDVSFVSIFTFSVCCDKDQ